MWLNATQYLDLCKAMYREYPEGRSHPPFNKDAYGTEEQLKEFEAMISWGEYNMQFRLNEKCPITADCKRQLNALGFVVNQIGRAVNNHDTYIIYDLTTPDDAYAPI